MKPKGIILITIISGSIALSLFFYREIYRFNLAAYYSVVRGMDETSMIAHGQTLYKNKKYRETIEFCKKIRTIYPRSSGAMELEGQSLIKLGKLTEGAELLAMSLSGIKRADKMTRRTIAILYKNGLYGDIIEIIEGIEDPTSVLYGYLGYSLYHRAKYKRAIENIKKALIPYGSETYSPEAMNLKYYMGLCYSRLGLVPKAIEIIEDVWRHSGNDKAVAGELISLYRRSGKIHKAELLLRKINNY